MISFDDACNELRGCFDVPGDALERAEQILELQHASLAGDPPMRSLPQAAAVAAVTRIRSGLPVIPRERWPIETSRVARLLRMLGGQIAPESAVEALALDFAEAALPAAQADDGRGVVKEAERFGLPAQAATALLREALKPEMLRLSLPFQSLVGDEPRAGRCPACGDAPAAATIDRHCCCRWCGTIWAWDGAKCPWCGKAELHAKEILKIARGAQLLQCMACAEDVPLFPVTADPLLLSMLAVLVAPFELAVRMEGEAQPSARFAVF